MPTYTQNRLTLAFPAEDIALLERLGRTFDPDSGGDETFVIERQRNGYVWTETVVYQELEPLLRARDPAQWFPLLSELATMKGVEPLTLEEVTHLCSVCLIDDEFTSLPDDEAPPPE